MVSQEVKDAWEEAHDKFCPRRDACSVHLKPGDRHMLSKRFSPDA